MLLSDTGAACTCICPQSVPVYLVLSTAGGSIPYASQTAAKQPYLRDYLWSACVQLYIVKCRLQCIFTCIYTCILCLCSQWRAESVGRSQAAPHIKTYLRVSPDQTQLAWLLLTRYCTYVHVHVHVYM